MRTPCAMSSANLILCLALGLTLLAPCPARAVVVGTAQELLAAVDQANAGGDPEILLADGVYTLDRMLWIEADNLTVRSESGNADAVVIEGQGMAGDVTHVFNVAGSHFTARDLTLGRVSQHAFQTQPCAEAPTLRNLRILDTGEQMVKIAFDQDRPDLHTDNGLIEGCLFEYTAGVGPQYYIGGIDCHAGRDWVVRNNTFRGIRSPSDQAAEHAVHFWSMAENTLVERNLIVNCDRGIGFGLGDRGHVGGIIRNNMIFHDASQGFADAGITLESAQGAQVYNNTVIQEHPYPNAIEYRFPATRDVSIANNLTNRDIACRDGASGMVEANLIRAQPSWFVLPSAGDLHLAAAAAEVVDRGAAVPGLTEDIDGDARPQGRGVDIGADEYAQ